ncbi:MAG: ATP-binding protein, partial [Treponema sp.]|nr:ATP-binding protein [Treponema sp.]
SLSTQNPQLRPVISVVQKALANGASEYLAELYNLGRQEHSKHRLYLRLSEEEREFLLGSPVIPYAAEFYNYPISFYNMRERQWQGIFFDILDELIELTGLHFEIVNDENTIWTDLLGMLIDGEAYLITELLQSEARVGNFLWPSTPTITDNYALLSKSETPNVSLNEVFNVRVGVPRATAYADMLHSWFPLHTNIVEYESFDATFEALNRGDVDMVLTSQNQLLTLTNYYELSGYKANLIFEYAAESFIGFHIDQAVLCSIIDKALHLIDVRGISYQWASRTFDFQARLLQAQRPWLIGAIALASMVLLLMTVLFARSRSTGKRLDSLVKKRTAELEIAIEAANAANKSKSSFLANMSHEIRTPMNTILGVTDILMQNESLPDEVAEGLNRIYGSSDMLMGIINDILDLSKIEAGKLDIIPSQYYVASLINDSIHLNLMRIGDKPIEFDIQIDENLPAKLMGDELRIKQIFNNLLSNAFKYTESGKVTMSVLCEPCDNGVMLVVSVQDTGRGMTPEQVAKLFDEYSRFDEASSRSIEGTGLGLSITQRLINLMDGKIHVESTPGVGTLFSVSLPQGMVDSEILGMELAASLQQFRLNDMMQKNRGQVKREMMPYGKVLVVDDVEANLFVAEGLLKPYKLRIETVISGYAAIEKIKEGKIYDIVFMDHMMPGMDGIETVKHIRDLGYSSSIVALTANAVAGQADIFLQSGFNDFISKPIDTRQLNSVLNKMIRDKQPQEVLEAARSTVASSQADSVPAAADTQLANIKINGLDIIMGLDKFEDDTELYLRILRSYTSSVTAILPLMENVNEETLIDDKLAEYQRATHSVKGTSLDICAEQIGNKAGELEDAAKEKNLNFIVNENPEFLDNLKKLIRDIEDMLSGFDGKTIKPKKDKIESELLLKLQGFCENYDMDGVDTVMAEIEEYEYESDHDLSAWLRKNVDVIDFDVIAERLSAENGINK